MSIELMSKVWRESPETGNQKLVLLALADYANDDGVLYPSLNKVAKKAGISRTTAQRIIRKYRKSGVVEVVEKGGVIDQVNRANTYKIHADKIKVKSEFGGYNQ